LESTEIEPFLATEDEDKVVVVNMKTNQPSNDAVVTPPPTIDEKKDEAGQDDNDNNDDDEEEHHHHPKKYMGVARIRRQKVKEQKAQRLKDITDAEILGGGGGGFSSPSRSDLVREISAEIATMDITASMVRKGGMVVDENTIGKWTSANGLLWKNKNSTRRSWRWYTSLVLPPMKLVPRLITLLLLFLAGLDLGTQPYRPSSFSLVNTDFASTIGTTGGGSRSSSLIGHVELSLTKPWEYGMGGKVAYMVGMTSTSPPTALPTYFSAASDDDDDDDDDSMLMECDALNEFGRSNKAECGGDTTSTTKINEGKMKNANKNAIKKKNNIKLQLMEDEFDSTRTRPRGVHHRPHPDGVASEFDDDDYDPSTSINNNIIDPLFQVDLDALLRNAHLPLPIDYAAKFAIGFHRTWVHYLWKLPTSLVKSIFGIPMNLMSGWIANPPWILGVVLLIRFITRVLVGTTSTKSFSLGSENDEASDNSSGVMGGGGGGGNLDVLEKVMGAAKNYASSSFPKTSFVFGTLMQVMKVDMYVLLCGMLIGLVMCSFDEELLGWSGGTRSNEGGARSGYEEVLGDGEF
jgi:hypothetical protein